MNKKIRKVETAELIIESGMCLGINCKYCFNSRDGLVCELGPTGGTHNPKLVELAEAYRKRYARPNNRVKKVDTSKKAKPERTPLEVAKAIRDNEYKFDCKYEETGCGDCAASGFCIERGICHKEAVDIYIAGHNDPDHCPDTTKKVEPKKKYVRCIDGGSFPLTSGKVYEIIAKNNEYYAINNDLGNNKVYEKTRFEPAEKPDVKERFTEPQRRAMEKVKRYFQNDKVKISCDWGEPQPLSFDDPVPEKVYVLNDKSIAEKDVDFLSLDKDKQNNITELVFDKEGKSWKMSSCYKTLDDAVKVFLSRRGK